MWLQPKLWESIHEVVQAARRAMAFLSSSAKVAAKEGLPINWRLSDGFYVEQRYSSWQKRRVMTVIDGEVVRLLLKEEKDEMDKGTMASAIAPNFIHSLGFWPSQIHQPRLTRRIAAFALVHDSYGTVAADVEAMTSYIRRALLISTRVAIRLSFSVKTWRLWSQNRRPYRHCLPRAMQMGTCWISHLWRGPTFFFA